ncbi:DUF1589 domain-containing protein [Rhodopirellula europaea]
MLWNKASRPNAPARLPVVRPNTPPGTAWPTFVTPRRVRKITQP